MKRRLFLQTAGAASAATLLGPLAGSGNPASTENVDPAMFLDRDRLRHRNQNRSTVVCQNGIVCASQPLSAVAGLDILKAGGNAIDAAVCTNAMLSVVEPMSCGPGGDLFAIAWIEKDRKLCGLNASGRSPYDWNLEKAAQLGMELIPAHEPLAWSVPGCVSGWAALLERFGSRNLAQVLEPAIHYAREGFRCRRLSPQDGPAIQSSIQPWPRLSFPKESRFVSATSAGIRRSRIFSRSSRRKGPMFSTKARSLNAL